MTDRIHDAFDQVVATEDLRQATRDRVARERARRARGKVVPLTRRLAYAACVLVAALVVSLGGYGVAAAIPVSYISIDVNPSIELSLNRWDRVVDARACNDDGATVLASVDVAGMGYAEAVDAIVGSDAMAPYLAASQSLTVTVLADDTAKESQLEEGIAESEACRGRGARCCTADPSVRDQAAASGMSFGKYSAYLELAALDPTVTAEDASQMTMAQIDAAIEDCGGEAAHAGNGRQNGHRHGR